ncbi:MAG: FAD-binding oxidoreductase, partial [Pseudomonadales bacterium]|nr:FAD-binding oxidoreductase [Pseudomonadales bacterium]
MENQASQAGINIATPIRFRDSLPEAADLVVIGGGIVGIFTALYANRLGVKVLVLEKGRVAGEQSSRNWGWCRQQGRDADELPIVMEANRLWGDIDKELNGKAGFVRGGCLYLARGEERLAELAEWIEIAKTHQLETRLLSLAELVDCIDLSACGGRAKNPWVGGLWTPSDARAEPWAAVPAVASLAQSEGVMIREVCAVRALDRQAGKVEGVITESGCVRAEQVVLAGGAWSSLLLQHHGIFVPQLSFKATVAQTAELPGFFDGTAADEGLAFRRREDGGFTLADRDPVDLYLGRDALKSARYYLPTLKSSLANPRIRPFGPKEFPDSWSTPRRWNDDAETPFERTRVLDPEPNVRSAARVAEQFAK